jgi:hypothetical protein
MSNPNLAQTIETAVLALPPDMQQEVLDFALFLRQRAPKPSHRRALRGLWADLNVDLDEADLAAARREAWAPFPRSDI